MSNSNNDKLKAIIGKCRDFGVFIGFPGLGGKQRRSGKKEAAGDAQPAEDAFQLRWYHSRWLEPILGIVLGFLLLIGLSGGPGEALKNFLWAAEMGMDGSKATSALAQDNSSYYSRYCQACHGEKGEIPGRTETLKQSLIANGEEQTVRRIREGQGRMPAFGNQQTGRIPEEGMKAILKWIRTNGADQPSSGAMVPARTDLTPAPSNAGSSGHDQTWRKDHGSYVSRNGLGACYKCHSSSSCVNCHVAGGD